MSTAVSLSKVVRRLGSQDSQRPSRLGEVILFYSERSGTVSAAKPRFSFGQRLQPYAVLAGRPARGKGPSIRLHSSKSRGSFELEITFEAWCEPGSEADLVSLIHGREKPELLVEQLIEAEITAFGLSLRAEGRDLAAEFYAFARKLEDSIRISAKRELGLVLVPNIRPRLEDRLERATIETGHFEARPIGASQELGFECRAELDVDPDRRTAALLQYQETERLSEVFRAALKEAIQTEVTLQELADGMLFQRRAGQDQEVQERVIGCVDARLQGIGRKVAFIRLSAPGLLEPKPVQLEYDVECSIADQDRLVLVKHRLRMKPQDLGRIVASGVDNPDDWAQVCLKERTESALIQLSYVELFEGAGVEDIGVSFREDAEAVGFKVEQLVSRIELEPLEASNFQMDYEVSCPIRDSDQNVKVKHRLLVEPVERSLIVKAGIQDPQSWIRDRLKQHTRSLLFRMTYLDLLLNFDTSEIEAKISKEVSGIGYSVQQLISIPDMEPLTWRDGLTVECGRSEFATLDSRIRVGLEIVVTGRIESLEDPKIQAYLGPDSARIYSDIERETNQAVQRVMHEIPPHSFYLGFRNAGVADRLDVAIRQALEERFSLIEASIVLKPLETELTKRIQYLVNGPHRVIVDCFPLRAGGRSEKVRMNVAFDILGVAEPCWHIFYAKEFESPEDELDKIKGELRDGIRSRLDTVPARELQYQSRSSQALLAKSMAPVARQIYRSFGLEIRLFDVYREPTEGEQQNSVMLGYDISEGTRQGKAVTDLFHSAARSRLEKLLAKEEEMQQAGYEDDDDEMHALRERIRSLKDEALPYRTREERQHVPLLENGDVDFSPTEYEQELLPVDATGEAPGTDSRLLAEGELIDDGPEE